MLVATVTALLSAQSVADAAVQAVETDALSEHNCIEAKLRAVDEEFVKACVRCAVVDVL